MNSPVMTDPPDLARHLRGPVRRSNGGYAHRESYSAVGGPAVAGTRQLGHTHTLVTGSGQGGALP